MVCPVLWHLLGFLYLIHYRIQYDGAENFNFSVQCLSWRWNIEKDVPPVFKCILIVITLMKFMVHNSITIIHRYIMDRYH